MSFFKLAIIGLVWAFAFLGFVYSQNETRFTDIIAAYPSELLDNLTEYQLVRIDDDVRVTSALAARNLEPFTINIDGKALSFQLRPLEMRAPNFRRITTDGLLSTQRAPTTQFRGAVVGGGEATFTLAIYWNRSGFLRPVLLTTFTFATGLLTCCCPNMSVQ